MSNMKIVKMIRTEFCKKVNAKTLINSNGRIISKQEILDLYVWFLELTKDYSETVDAKSFCRHFGTELKVKDSVSNVFFFLTSNSKKPNENIIEKRNKTLKFKQVINILYSFLSDEDKRIVFTWIKDYRKKFDKYEDMQSQNFNKYYRIPKGFIKKLQ